MYTCTHIIYSNLPRYVCVHYHLISVTTSPHYPGELSMDNKKWLFFCIIIMLQYVWGQQWSKATPITCVCLYGTADCINNMVTSYGLAV